MQSSYARCAALVALVLSGCAAHSPVLVVQDEAPTRVSGLAEVWDYADWLRDATAADVRSELSRHSAVSLDDMSAIDAIRLALLYMHDATLATGDFDAQHVLMHLAGRVDEAPDIAALARLLADALRPTVVPAPSMSNDSVHNPPVTADAVSELRRELESERARRRQLEQQIEALLRLEEQLDGQDDDVSR
jgi:hypothetical protein